LILRDSFNSIELTGDSIRSHCSYLLAKSQISAKLMVIEAVSRQYHYRV
jgi:hypothetical protein